MERKHAKKGAEEDRKKKKEKNGKKKKKYEKKKILEEEKKKREKKPRNKSNRVRTTDAFSGELPAYLSLNRLLTGILSCS